MTFAVLRALHALIGDALDDIERIYAESGSSSQSSRTSTPGTPSTTSTAPFPTHKSSNSGHGHAYASPPPSPLVSSHSQNPSLHQHRSTTPTSTSVPNTLDFPSLDLPFDPNSPSENLTSHPVVISAVNRIVAATGQMSATVQIPFLTLCDAGMGFHLPSCLRLLEASHTVEILREAGPNGLHVKLIAEKNGVDKNKLESHLMNLCRGRIPSLSDMTILLNCHPYSPETKYNDTNGVSAFFGMCTDELFKSAGFLTETYLLSPQKHKNGLEPTRAPFNHAFGCEGVGFFGWLEGEGIDGNHVNGPGRDEGFIPGIVIPRNEPLNHRRGASSIGKSADMYSSKGSIHKTHDPVVNPNRFRLERFGKAMTGTASWEAPGAVLNGFDWQSLPQGSVVVDVGGGIGSTSMLLAHAYSDRRDNSSDDDVPGLKFIIQDRESILGLLGFKAMHDFFTPQPIKNAAVFLLRVVLHDWPDAFAQRILLRLREAARPDTKLLIADFVLPLACADSFGSAQDEDENGLTEIQGAEMMLAPAPLLPNLGKASANGYCMDMTMQCMFNGQERTLREIVSLAHSAGWKVTKVTKAPGSLFGHIVAIPIEIPIQRRARAGSGSAFFDVPNSNYMGGSAVDPHDETLLDVREMGRASSRCGTPTFGSRMDLPSYEEARAKFGGGLRNALRRPGTSALNRPPLKPTLLPAAGPAKKKRPSPLSVVPQSPSPIPRNVSSARPPPPPVPQSPLKRRTSYAQLNQIYSLQQSSPSPTPSIARQQPLSPRNQGSSLPLSRRASLANLSNHGISSPKEPPPPLPTIFNLPRASPVPSQLPLSPASPISSRPHLNSPSLSFRSSAPASPSLPHRKSYATLSPSAIPKKRTDNSVSNIGGLPTTLGGRGNTLMRTLELSGLTSGVDGPAMFGPLDFGDELNLDTEPASDDCEESMEESLPAGSVLAAAARIESLKGTSSRKPSMIALDRKYIS
ncbi:O-methyltransferase [Lentinula aciculospora]|uniref:O-methyltransferase n=1 Tax=Lentinula aciculospora TaxID=153920 RepID=A0A9W9A4N1_9AGAR|nr:O-methyltransferase [Lentinula aciculospora]